MRLFLATGLLALLAWMTPLNARSSMPLPLAIHADQTRFEYLTGELGCVIYPDGGLVDSRTDLAYDLRREAFQLMRAGRSEGRIRHDLLDRSSHAALHQPLARPATSLLWFAPIFALLLHATVLVMAERRRNGRINWLEQPW